MSKSWIERGWEGGQPVVYISDTPVIEAFVIGGWQFKICRPSPSLLKAWLALPDFTWGSLCTDAHWREVGRDAK